MAPTTITNVRIFDGDKINDQRSSISFDPCTGLIVPETDAATLIDGSSCTLLPGLWDTHVHLSNPTAQSLSDSLALCKDMIEHGITTAIDCGNLPSAHQQILQNTSTAPDILYVNKFATSTGSTHSKFQMAGPSSIVDTVEDAVAFVDERVKQGAHYIKIVADLPGPNQQVINQLSRCAHAHGKMTIVHASRNAAFLMALRAEPPVSVITHVPMDEPLTHEQAEVMKEKGIVSVPTLVMMETLAASGRFPNVSFVSAMESAKALHNAGVPILVGTDSNQSTVARVKHGEAVWREMELLQKVGLSNVEILRAATGLPAVLLGLNERGAVKVGKRADFVLVRGDPTTDIGALKEVVGVWKAGVEVFREGDAVTGKE
ncbi:uncharacterized protein N0V89_001998 [Didymosphaeria variabile]|uniref:Amidohydrolase-related domain-containing protein n=1 Tax=Didymosphaeria variabile TaxID=1932322 RepID=A0A9W8XTA9_9PLEO|nr:uncharacterized protein N0V89_001998 [Didymosphaeria variabile]KAJ4357423.1 hypothetical protein N0V89_001998 [Didymosphaeria variabile]